jgi:flagellin
VKDSLQRGQSTVDVAISAGETVSDLLLQMKEKALAASDVTLDTNSRVALNNDFVSLRDQISKAVKNADFNGANMLLGTNATQIMALANADGSAVITVVAQPMDLGSGALAALTNTSSIGTQTLGFSMIATINQAIINVSASLSALGTGSKSLGSHLTFIGKLQDTVDGGIGNLVDADLAKESAKLQSLQTKQQLGVQALSIANQAPNSIMSLFR